MIIGLIGFGKVSKNLTKIITSADIEFATSDELRSQKTKENISNSNVIVYSTFREVAEISDILISANSPKNAYSVAEEYGKYCSGIYLDLNNISPKTTLKIDKCTNNFVDGAIIGKIDSDKPVLYISGQNSDDLLFLNQYIETKKISNTVGDVSLLKLIRSSYTKTLSVILEESSALARKYNLEDEFFEVLSITEGDDFRQKSISRISNTVNNSKRKSEELEEIIDYFKSSDLAMTKAALKKLKRY